MKILHFSDTHLGYNELDKTHTNRMNIREQDFYDSFIYVIDKILEIKPDVVVHAGDFFHRPSPPNRPITVALQQLTRLSDADIPIVIIAGNHETPRSIYTAPILKAFNTIPNVYAIFGQEYETHEFGELVVHGLPHVNNPKALEAELDKIKPVKNKFNIIMMHTAFDAYMTDEYGQQVFPEERLKMLNEFDYVALGHIHNFQKVKGLETAWYSGSTERTSVSQIFEKVFCTLDLEKGKAAEPTTHAIPTRTWLRFDIKKCEDKKVAEIEAELLAEANKNKLEGALVFIEFQNIAPMQAVTLSNRRVHELLPDCLEIQIKRTTESAAEKGHFSDFRVESLNDLISDYIKTEVDDEGKAETLIDKAKHYIDLYESGDFKN